MEYRNFFENLKYINIVNFFCEDRLLWTFSVEIEKTNRKPKDACNIKLLVILFNSGSPDKKYSNCNITIVHRIYLNV